MHISSHGTYYLLTSGIEKIIDGLLRHWTRQSLLNFWKTPETLSALCFPLWHFFWVTSNPSRSGGHLGKVVAISKKGNKQGPLNYRLISLASILCKILAHILHSNFPSFFKSFCFVLPNMGSERSIHVRSNSPTFMNSNVTSTAVSSFYISGSLSLYSHYHTYVQGI